MLPIFFGFLNFQIQIFLFVLLFFLKTKGHDLIFLSDLHNYNIVGYTIAVALGFANIQFFHWEPYTGASGLVAPLPCTAYFGKLAIIVWLFLATASVGLVHLYS